MKLIRPFAMSLLATAALCGATAARAEVNVGVTLGYPGGYGIAQPAYVAPGPVYVQPAPVVVERGYGYPGWRERERERYYREHYRHHDGDRYSGNGWHDHDGGRDHDRGERHEGREGHEGHEGHNGWRR